MRLPFPSVRKYSFTVNTTEQLLPESATLPEIRGFSLYQKHGARLIHSTNENYPNLMPKNMCSCMEQGICAVSCFSYCCPFKVSLCMIHSCCCTRRKLGCFSCVVGNDSPFESYEKQLKLLKTINICVGREEKSYQVCGIVVILIYYYYCCCCCY